MRYYSDLREYIEALDDNGKLVRIRSKVVKEREIAPLYWLQYRGLPENQWKSFLFENVTDVKGRKHDRICMGPYSSSREIIALGMACKLEEINQKWSYALSHPVEPEIVESGAVQEVVHMGSELDTQGLEALAFPVEVPGFAGSIRTTDHMVTKDPETGIRNVGTYTGHVLGRKNLMWDMDPHHHGLLHILASRRRGKRLPVAVVIGTTPNIALVGAAPIPHHTDEFSIAGGIAGEPVKLVKCKTIDLEVPSTAEIVIEGQVSDEYVLGDPPSHGDYAGYMRGREGPVQPIIDVTCITHRKEPIFTSSVIGYGPTGFGIMATTIKELALYKHLNAIYSPRVLDIHYEHGGMYCVVKIRKVDPWDPWQVLYSLVGYEARNPKIAIAVDDDIDCRDPNSVNWALTFSMQPQRDIRIITHRLPGLDPSGFPPGITPAERRFPPPVGTSAILIDATRKWDYSPVALPKEEYMRQALKLWEEEGLPKLQLKPPWYGYYLGRWGAEEEQDAQLMVNGDIVKLGEKQAQHRIRLDASVD
jgi:UbiD family decarboxylase